MVNPRSFRGDSSAGAKSAKTGIAKVVRRRLKEDWSIFIIRTPVGAGLEPGIGMIFRFRELKEE